MVHKLGKDAKIYKVMFAGSMFAFEVQAISESDAKKEVDRITKGQLKRVEESGGEVIVEEVD